MLQQYNGSLPFGSFIKQFFSQHKKYGSKDRKNISQLCYAFFRLGKALPTLPAEERILTGLFLCSAEPNELLQHLKPDWDSQTHLSLADKWRLISDTDAAAGLLAVFPWKDELSANMDHTSFCASFFTQPDLFLRLRPRHEAAVKSKLQQAGVPFREVSRHCLALPNASKIDTVIGTDREAVIQDHSSQRIGELMEFIRNSAFAKASASDGSPPADAMANKPLRVWDACAASGGKSILATDIFRRIDLTVSDVRQSILVNLEKRFAAAGIRNYHSFIGDLSTTTYDDQEPGFDMIITDVPCSGSGTWSRTPEQLYYFDPKKIDRYSALQKKIIAHAIPALKPGGFLLYCTCSVFKKENEEVVQFIEEQLSLQLLQSTLFTGYEQKADTLFGAVFQKK